MRIPTLLQKISDLMEHNERPGLIEVDLMLDYTRVMYADLLELRTKIAAAQTPAQVPPAPAAPAPVTPAPPPPAATTPKPAPQPIAPPPVPAPVAPVVPASTIPVHEPTLAELAAAMDKQRADDEEEIPVPAAPVKQVPAAHHIPRPTATRPPILPETTERTHTTVKPPPPARPAAIPPSATAPKPEAPAADATAREGKDIRSMISINEKYQLMSELFSNDKSAYETALNHINSAGSEQLAIKWLQEHLWVTEERSDAVQNFYDMVGRFYRM